MEFFLPGGAVHALPYGQIAMIGTNENADTLTIQCQLGVVLRLTGQNLATLRTGLLRHRLAFVKAPAQGPDNVAVQNITLEYPSPDNMLMQA